MLSTIQDLGRKGYRKDGIIVSGAMDALALRIGNLLLGNPEGTGGIECTLTGPVLSFESAQLICITGADLSADIDGVQVKMWRPLFVKQGSILTFGAAISGCRAYVQVLGGFKLPLVLSSQSTYLKAGFGGVEGRALKIGDQLSFNVPYLALPVKSNWSTDLSKIYPDLQSSVIRIVAGPEYEWFTERARLALVEQTFVLDAAADRMGYRLNGPALELQQSRELLSSAVDFGTLQITGDGSAILLMADHQTTGGYPRIANVASVDLTLLAQMRTGHHLRFEMITLEQAHELLKQREKQMKQLKHTLMLREGFK